VAAGAALRRWREADGAFGHGGRRSSRRRREKTGKREKGRKEKERKRRRPLFFPHARSLHEAH
jgi:hypothetical protein